MSSVAVTLIWSANQVTGVIDKKDKNVQVLRTDTDFYAAADDYVNFNLEMQDFDAGQVVLIDDGEVDSCKAHLSFNSKISAVELTNNTVKVTLNYLEKPTLDKCSSTMSRPFYFYYLKTTKLLVFEEKIVE
jgi:hypothetical protein